MMINTTLSHYKAPPQGKVSFEEFLTWADEDTRAEWEDGEVIMASPASRVHQILVGWLASILGIYVRRRNLGEVLAAPFLVQLQVTQQGREPDLIFIKPENLSRLHETYFNGPPDMVIEIVSPESISRDRGRKFVEYEREGIPEYWLLDPIRQQAEFYQLSAEGFYRLALPDDENIYRSRSVAGFWLNTGWLWQLTLPDELDILRQLGVLD